VSDHDPPPAVGGDIDPPVAGDGQQGDLFAAAVDDADDLGIVITQRLAQVKQSTAQVGQRFAVGLLGP
jgi:hypothetical protein